MLIRYLILNKVRIQIDNVNDLIQCLQCKTIVHKVNSLIIEIFYFCRYFRNAMDWKIIKMNGDVFHVNVMMAHIDVISVRKLEEH
jgi:hypothetical protein